MKITKICDLDGKTYTMDIPKLTPQKLELGILLRNKGALIQNAFPYLSASEREFLMTGITPEAWDKMFGDNED